ncbi:MAG: malonyl-CoA decarboxylase family protein [bacterium]
MHVKTGSYVTNPFVAVGWRTQAANLVSKGVYKLISRPLGLPHAVGLRGGVKAIGDYMRGAPGTSKEPTKLIIDGGKVKVNNYTLDEFDAFNNVSPDLNLEIILQNHSAPKDIKNLLKGIICGDAVAVAISGINTPNDVIAMSFLKPNAGMDAFIAEVLKVHDEKVILRSLRDLAYHEALISIVEGIRTYAFKNKIPKLSQIAGNVLTEKAKYNVLNIEEVSNSLNGYIMKRLAEIKDSTWEKSIVTEGNLQNRIQNGLAKTVVVGGKIAGVIYGLVRKGEPANFAEFTGNGRYISDPKGDSVYCYSVATHLKMRGILAKELVLNAVKYVAKKFPNVKHFRTLSPLPGFKDYLLEVLTGKKLVKGKPVDAPKHMLTAKGIISYFSEDARTEIVDRARKTALFENSTETDDEIFKKLLIERIEKQDWRKDMNWKAVFDKLLTNAVQMYLIEQDPKTGRYIEGVRDFHYSNGAKFVGIIPNSRPEDSLSMGVHVIYEYPHPRKEAERKYNIWLYNKDVNLTKRTAGEAVKGSQ